jgi:hypothetical protein
MVPVALHEVSPLRIVGESIRQYLRHAPKLKIEGEHSDSSSSSSSSSRLLRVAYWAGCADAEVAGTGKIVNI